MGGSLAPSWGGGGQQTHPGEPEEVKSACLGQRRKGAQGGDGDETITMSPCTDAEGGAGGEERELWPGQKAWRGRLFWKQHFGLKNPRALQYGACEGKLADNTGTVLLRSRFLLDSADVGSL